jgi:hypothetical protein
MEKAPRRAVEYASFVTLDTPLEQSILTLKIRMVKNTNLSQQDG